MGLVVRRSETGLLLFSMILFVLIVSISNSVNMFKLQDNIHLVNEMVNQILSCTDVALCIDITL